MVTGWIAWTSLLLAAGQSGTDDVVHMSTRGFQIPIVVKPDRRADVRELYLYCSKDQGRTWQRCAIATPDRKGFEFNADTDGIHFFSVAVKDRRGYEDPPNINLAPVGQKICIDTVKPVVKILSAERAGDEIRISWEIREERPNWSRFKLEYRVSDSPNGLWTPLHIQAGERGNYTLRTPSAGEVTVKLSLADLAGNEASEEKIVPAGNAVVTTGGVVGPPGTTGGLNSPGGAATLPDRPPPPPAPPPTPSVNHTPVGSGASAPAISSRSTDPPVGAIGPTHAGSTGMVSSAAMPTRGSLPNLQIINKREAKLDFGVSRFGPSGLGSVEVWLTTDEGTTWEKMPGDPAASLPVSPEVQSLGPVRGTVTVHLPREGVIYGVHLVVKSRAGLSKPPPRSGDAPQVRIEVDTTQPAAELYAPQADPSRSDSLTLIWKADDRNLDTNPISLEWARGATGPWEFIGDPQLPNTGRYTWKVPPNIPPKVFLKLTVRDKAGNVAVAQTGDAVVIDMSVPEVTGSVTVTAGSAR